MDIDKKLDNLEKRMDEIEDNIICHINMVHSLLVLLNEKAIDNL